MHMQEGFKVFQAQDHWFSLDLPIGSNIDYSAKRLSVLIKADP
jgi:hypothetical protein